jgi:hemolysin III
MLLAMERITLGKMQNPVRGFLHGAAAIAALAGLIVLLALNPGGLGLTLSLAVYAGSLVVMFTISSLYHSIPWSTTWKRRMQRLDHAAIFLVVAGTFTPFAEVALEGAWKTAMLAAVWAAAGVGIVIKMLERHPRLAISVTIQSAMGWATVVSMWQIAARLGVDTVVLIGVGGVLYTVGMIMFLIKRPRLSPRIFSAHELFHVLVVAASSVHFYAVVTRVLPAAV